MRNLRIQLLVSHFLLVGLMVLVLAGAVVSFLRLGESIDRILKDNYKSVIAAQDMKEALERQDSAATFFLAGKQDKARRQYQENRPRFRSAFDVEDHNITEPGERQIADDIGRQFADYTKAVERLLYADPPLPTDQASAWYFGTLEPAFLRLKQRAQDVLDLNQRAILRADERARQESHTASWTGITVMAGASILAILFALGMVRSALAPLRSLARQAEEIGIGHLNQRIELRRSDEIGALADSFNDMSVKLQAARALAEERLHRAERMSDAALESLYDPVIVTDAAGRVVHLNRAAEGLFGPEHESLGLPVARVAKESRIPEAVERAVRHKSVSALEGEAGFVPIHVGDSKRFYRLRANPMHDEERLLGAVVVLEDVTHLRELDQLKTEFIGVASHELRTPVTSLLLSAQVLDEGAAGPLSPEQKEIVAAQKEDLQRLERMMRDLLDITRLEAGVTPPRFEIVPAGDLVRNAVESISAQAESKGIHLQSEAGEDVGSVRADRGQIARVLLNLLNNAVRHTRADGQVRLEARGRDGRIEFTVSDTGSGISAEYLSRVFDRFVQVPGATRGGAGLGLSIAQTIVKAHGGEITVQSEPGKGATFRFSLQSADRGKEG